MGSSRLQQAFTIMITTSVAMFESAAFATAPLSVSNEFHYQGVLRKADGSPLTGKVTINFQILSSNALCLLYEEQQTNVDLTATKGVFNLKVGSNLRATKRVPSRDPGLDMTTVFTNRSAILPAGFSAECPGGFNPADNESRILRVSVEQGAVWRTITQDQVLSSVPTALVAQSLQGLTINDFDTRYVSSSRIGTLINN